ncbi:MAG TPA: ribonuclease G [Steroidobacteraceae bacterium]
MTTEILINVAPRENRAALVENGVLTELFVERQSRRGIVSNLYKGRVQRVLPGMQAAFIDVGLERTAFLHAADIALPISENTLVGMPEALDIKRLVNEGDDILVQVVKDPMGTKGARLTTFVALPSRLMVYMPRGEGVGVSARIEDEAERARLKALVADSVLGDGASDKQGGGYIVRTAAQGADAEAIREDMKYLCRLWQHVREKGLRARAGELVYEDLPLPTRILRDELARGVDRVLVDNATSHAQMLEFAAAFMPGSTTLIELYQGARPIFDLHGVEDETAKALDRNVSLKSGGHLVIDQTESMTTIDVNTGGFVGHRNLEDTIFRTNLEAAVAIARQLRLRNLGGIIIIDFIDMTDAAHRTQVMDALQRALAGDHAQTHIASVSSLGLVEMTRKRTRDSLEHLLCAACPSCEGRGFVRTPETVCHEIFREIVRQSRQFESRELLILAHQNVIDRLLDEESAVLAELEHQIGRPIRLQVEALYGFDQYDVVLA